MKKKFDFYEIVRIAPQNGTLDLTGLDARKFDYQTLVGSEGPIVAMSRDKKAWYCLVKLSNKIGDEYLIRENDLEATGKKAKREDFYTGESIRVRVDPKTGEGSLVDE
jgi:hypothetical protein